MNFSKDYYTILQTAENATQQEIRAAYRKLAMQYHPDRNRGNKEYEEILKKVNEASGVLSDPAKKFTYDEYRRNLKEQVEEEHEDKSEVVTEEPKFYNKHHTRTYTRKKKVTKEIRIYVKGKLVTKFYGKQKDVEGTSILHEVHHTINPTEAEIIIEAKSTKPFEEKAFQELLDEQKIFTTFLKRPIRCKVVTENGNVYYLLDIREIKIGSVEVSGVVYEGIDIYGTLQGNLYGYIQTFEEKEEDETVTEFFGSTGNTENKQKNTTTYQREAFYYKDGSTYWGAWQRGNTVEDNTSTVINREENYSGWWWLIALFVLMLFAPELGLSVAVIAGILLSIIFGRIIIHFIARSVQWLWGLLLLFFLFVEIKSCLRNDVVPVPVKTAQNDTIKENFTPADTGMSQAANDYFITHYITWSDLQNRQYKAGLSVLASDVKSSSLFHQNLRIFPYSNSLASVYADMLKEDDAKLKFLYSTYDSIISSNHLGEYGAASMMVSCIQNFPYAVVVDKDCDAQEYEDNFTRQYIQNCNGNCCVGYEQYGVRTPVEFLSDLRGDCDTKALLLYGLLKHFGYDAALLTSNYYKHAIIAVHFQNNIISTAVVKIINGKLYYVWETTSPGFDAGQLTSDLSNMNEWNVNLLTRQ